MFIPLTLINSNLSALNDSKVDFFDWKISKVTLDVAQTHKAYMYVLKIPKLNLEIEQ